MKDCKSEPSNQWDNPRWLNSYGERTERLKKVLTLSAPRGVVAREIVLVLHSIAHLDDSGGFSDPETSQCVIRFLERDISKREGAE